MNYKIIQPAGLGDILFCLKIARAFAESGKVYWPVVEHYSFVKDYIQIPNVEFNDGPAEIEINLQSAGHANPESVMEAKYELVKMKSDGWRDAFEIKRNVIAERNAFCKYILRNKPYAVIGDTFATPPDVRKLDIPLPDMQCVKLSDMFDVNPFDCSMIIQGATEIHLVDTCFAYIIDKISLSTNKMFLYSRNYKIGPSTHKHTRHLWRKKWEFID